jgi:hypothetical protein
MATVSGWTTDTWAAHSTQMDELRQRTNMELDNLRDRLSAERDRRYAEVNTEKEKALAIKTEADKTALGLQRDVQTYKDEKANNLREQIGSERGNYASKDDVTAASREFEARLKGAAASQSIAYVIAAVSAIAAIVATMSHFVH